MSSAEMSSAEPSAQPGPLQEGHVKWYSIAHGYGFLSAEEPDDLPATDDESIDVFVHHSVVGQPEDLVPGERVRFAVEAGPKGLLATRLERFD